jgi:hypothetical protein
MSSPALGAGSAGHAGPETAQSATVNLLYGGILLHNGPHRTAGDVLGALGANGKLAGVQQAFRSPLVRLTRGGGEPDSSAFAARRRKIEAAEGAAFGGMMR